MEHVTLVNDHRILDPGAGWLLARSVQYLDDTFGELNGSSSMHLSERRKFVVVCPVPQPPQRFQVAAALFHGCVATVAQAIDEVLMCPVCSWYGKLQVGKQARATWKVA